MNNLVESVSRKVGWSGNIGPSLVNGNHGLAPLRCSLETGHVLSSLGPSLPHCIVSQTLESGINCHLSPCFHCCFVLEKKCFCIHKTKYTTQAMTMTTALRNMKDACRCYLLFVYTLAHTYPFQPGSTTTVISSPGGVLSLVLVTPSPTFVFISPFSLFPPTAPTWVN